MLDLRTKWADWIRSAGVPEDCIRGRSSISVQGHDHVSIENFKGLVSYTEEEIRVLTKQQKICVAGKKLQIDCYTKEEIEISGLISRIEFLSDIR